MYKVFKYSCFFFITSSIYSQPLNSALKDSLAGKDYAILADKIDAIPNKKLQLVYSNVYLRKAKQEHNPKQIAEGYKLLLHLSERPYKLKYADSMVAVAVASGKNELIGSCYLTKGIVFYESKKMNDALATYLKANSYLSKTDDQYLLHKVKFNIALVKHYLWADAEAISILKECVAYFKGKEEKPYLSSLHSLGLCYIRTKQFGLCRATNAKGIAEAKRVGNSTLVSYFKNSEGANQYFKRNFRESIQLLQEGLPVLIQSRDFANEATAYYYLGMDYLKTGKRDVAMVYFKKVDEIFLLEDYISPDIRGAYEELIKYYRDKHDEHNELIYIRILTKANESLFSNYKFLNNSINKEYDNVKLRERSNYLEASWFKRNILDYGLVILIIILSITAFSYFRKKRLYREKFEVFIARATTPPVKKPAQPAYVDINPEIISAVTARMEKFEREQKYLEKEVTVTKLAQLCGTNTKYVSRIILAYKNKKTTDYINDLKIEHIVALLTREKKYSQYTFKALCEEGGFITTQHFTRAFFNYTGINPVVFMEEMRKKHERVQAD
ncbi:MAG: AraC family transcriptional regulator [Flavobacterium sp.]|nr:AraC family transcriptional regulator [Flavobacterium sp.]